MSERVALDASSYRRLVTMDPKPDGALAESTDDPWEYISDLRVALADLIAFAEAHDMEGPGFEIVTSDGMTIRRNDVSDHFVFTLRKRISEDRLFPTHEAALAELNRLKTLQWTRWQEAQARAESEAE